jgi:hypothetical protein
VAISYNTGTTFKVANSGTPSGTGTIPAGVASGNLLYVVVMTFTTATGAVVATLTSSATAPVAVGSQQATGIVGGQQVTSGVWSIAAGPGDPGATLTFGAAGGTGGTYWFNVGLVAYSGASGTDVSGGNNEAAQGQTTANITTPSLTTGAAGDWQIQAVTGGPPSTFDYSPVPPTGSGLTLRQSIPGTGGTSNAGLLLYIADSNSSAGGAGAAIGNTAWTGTAVGGAANVMTSFTVGVAAAAAPPPAAATVLYSMRMYP